MAYCIDAIFATYALICLLHLTLQLLFAHAHHLRRRNAPACAGTHRVPTISVIYPIYNESPEVLQMVLQRAKECLVLPGLEIVLVDDGSPNRAGLQPIYDEYRCSRIRILYQENRGKREAQYSALACVTGELIVTVDSDTLIDPDGIRKLVAPLLDDARIGAVCGEVVVENSDVNLLTRIMALRYWTSFNLERAAQSFFKSVLCCSGPFSAYRADLLQRIKENYIRQTFFGRRCTYGDDRHLTNLVLGESYQVVYEPGAVGRTFVPESLGDYIKQQNRWNKSFYREIIWTLRIPDCVHPYSMLDMLLQPVLFAGFSVSLSHSAQICYGSGDWAVLLYYPLTLVVMSTVRSTYGLLRTLDPRFLLFVVYGFLHVLVLVPLRFKSVLTLNDNRWGTRAGKSNPYRDFAKWAAGYSLLLAVLACLLGLFGADSPVDARAALPRFRELNAGAVARITVALGSSIGLMALLAAAPRIGKAKRRQTFFHQSQIAEQIPQCHTTVLPVAKPNTR